ncbi:MAG: GTPase ObgE, partial [Fimbriimonadaceae bacterium]
MFLDEAVVTFNSGRGGAGAASFHKEKHVPRGGPDGADGGRGGDIVLIADRSRRTLYDFQLKTEFTAPNGIDAHRNKDGHNGKSIEIRVPVGTVVYDHESNTPLVDLSVDGMRTVLCKGGRGGFGNLHYTNSVRQAPTLAQKGAPGDSIVARLELKLLADVGLIGLPN